MSSKPFGWEGALGFLKSIDSFRYAQKYIVPTIAKEIELVEKIEDAVDDAAFIDQLGELLPGFKIHFRLDPNETDSAITSAFELDSMRATEYLTGFSNLIFDAINRTIPKSLSMQEVRVNLPSVKIVEDAGGDFFIPSNLLLKIYGVKEFRVSIGIYRDRMTQLYKDACGIIEEEDKKKTIFKIL